MKKMLTPLVQGKKSESRFSKIKPAAYANRLERPDALLDKISYSAKKHTAPHSFSMFRTLLFILTIAWISTAMAISEDNLAFIHASSIGDLRTARALLSKGVDVNARIPGYGGTALMLAAMNGKLKMAELLLNNGADVNATSPEGHTALTFATIYGYKDVEKLMLAHGASIDAKNKLGLAVEATGLKKLKQDPVEPLKKTEARMHVVSSPISHEIPILGAPQNFASGEAAFKLGNIEEAIKFYQKAAEQGHVTAQYKLGAIYEKGQGVTQDFVQAAYWFRKAAEQGDALAEFGMGMMYDIGRGLAQDYQQAFSWYGKAAEHGSVQAQNNLGFMHSEGKGVVRDYVKAHMWFNIAGARGYEDGRKNRDFVEKLLLPAQLVLAQQLANEWMEAHP